MLNSSKILIDFDWVDWDQTKANALCVWEFWLSQNPISYDEDIHTVTRTMELPVLEQDIEHSC